MLTGLVTAGAFAAFLSTSSGLTIAVAGVLSQDVTGRRWGTRRLGGVAAFRVAAAIAVVVPLLLSLPAQDVAVARTVGLAFAVTASTFAPLLMLGIWWRGLTPAGAVAGLLVGGLGLWRRRRLDPRRLVRRPDGPPPSSASRRRGRSRPRSPPWWSCRG